VICLPPKRTAIQYFSGRNRLQRSRLRLSALSSRGLVVVVERRQTEQFALLLDGHGGIDR